VLPSPEVVAPSALKRRSVRNFFSSVKYSIEGTIDYLRPEQHPVAKRIKDMASAAVFVSYINCVVVWGVLLWPCHAVWRYVARWFEVMR
jgi:diacylglycerol kinase (ATP)